MKLRGGMKTIGKDYKNMCLDASTDAANAATVVGVHPSHDRFSVGRP